MPGLARSIARPKRALGRVASVYRERGASFLPYMIFTAGEQGAWYDPSDLTTMFQDSAGTTPVTATGQTVGLVLDKSKGLVLGPERITNGTFDTNLAGWTTTGSTAGYEPTWDAGTVRIVRDGSGDGRLTQSAVFVVGRFYTLTFNVTNTTVDNLAFIINGVTTTITTRVGAKTYQFFAAGADFQIRTSGTVTANLDNISVKELPGNHATQSVLASRPILQQDANGKFYLLFDGSDDFLVTPTITPGTDKAQVFAGVRKLSDAATAMLLKTSTDAGVNAGTLLFMAPPANTSPSYGFYSRGSVAAGTAAASALSFPSPVTSVVTGLGDIAADNRTVRVNGAASGTPNTSDQGTGNYLAYPAYIGRRAGTSNPFNGRLYGLIARFGPNLSDVQIAQTEQWLNQKTGAF